MAKNLILGLIFACFGPNLVPSFFFFFLGATSIRCYTLLQTIIVCNFKENQRTKLEKMAKNLVLGPIFAQLAQIRPAIFFFFFKLLALSVTRYHGQLLSCTVWENLMIQCWENLVTKVRTERWTDGWEWFYRTLRLTSSVQKWSWDLRSVLWKF